MNDQRTRKSKFQIFAAVLITVALFVLPVFSQLNDVQKAARAKALYDEATILVSLEVAKALQEAFERYRESRELYSEVGDEIGKAKASLGIGFVLSSLGESEGALKAFQEAQSIFEEKGEIFQQARTLNNIGWLYDSIEDKSKALEYYARALPLRRSIGDVRGEAVTRNNIGSVYRDLGENQKALEYFESALPAYIAAKDKHGEAIVLDNLGKVFDNLGDQETALNYLQRALPIRIAEKDAGGEATTLNNIGLAYSNSGNEQKALEFYLRSLKIVDYLGSRSMRATLLNNIGAANNDLGNHQTALENYEAALPLCRAVGDKSCEAIALNNLGLVFFALGKHTEALTNFNTALPIFREIGASAFEAINLKNLMRSWKKLNKPDVAIFYGKQAVNKYQELRAAIKGLDAKTQKLYLNSISDNYRILADLLIEQGLYRQAEEVLTMLKEEEYSEFVRRDIEEIKTLGERVSLNKNELELLERYTALGRKVAEIGSEFRKLDEKKRRLAKINAGLNADEAKQLGVLGPQLNEANAAFQTFLKSELVRAVGERKSEDIEIDRDLQARLKEWGKGTVSLYTVVTEDRYRVILTTPNLQIDGKTEIPSKDLNTKIFAFRAALQDIEIDPRPLAKELYDILLKPIEKELNAANAKTIMCPLEGNLRYIPPAALSPDGKTYLLQKYRNAVITPRTREDLSNSKKDWFALGVGVSQALTIANPDKPERKINFAALPGTKLELETIVKTDNAPNEKGILPGNRLIDAEFNYKNFTNSLSREAPDGSGKFSLVHIASHFRLGNSWANSFLLLGDGQILTLEKIINSPEISFGKVELVTLSACNTAYADGSNGQEVDSLAGTIQAKSGKSVLAKL